MNYHGGDIKSASKKYGIPEDKIIDFSANINPLPHPPEIKRLLRSHSGNIRHYPQPAAAGLVAGIAKYLGITPRHIIPGCGSIELIYLVVSSLRPKRALIFSPTFSEYGRALDTIGAKVYFQRIGDFSAVGGKIDMAFICNPNNPTADIFKADDLLRFIKGMRHTCFVIDEVFMDFVKNSKDYTLKNEALRNKRIIILGSLTKFFAIAGLRVGYLAAHTGIISRLNKFRYPWAVNYPAQVVSGALLKDKAFIRKSREFMFREREYLYKSLGSIKGLEPKSPTANFIFCKTSINSRHLADLLGKKGILIRDCSTFRSLRDKYFRVAVRTREENRRLITELKRCLKNSS